MKNFVIVGAAGFIAPRHMKAIKETNNNLIAAMDPSDNVGILDTYFPNAEFFTDFSRLDRYLSKLRLEKTKIDFITICTPNFLHDFYIRYALKNNINAICEKPLVINPKNLEEINYLEKKSNKKIYTILQLRNHPNILKLRNEIKNKNKYDVELTYITSRGKWYHISWKGDEEKSGGILMNIGIHFFDLLIWVFGSVKKYELHHYSKTTATGFLGLERANVKWFLSIDEKFIPKINNNKKTYRLIRVNKDELDLDYDFNNLHTITYDNIFKKKGYGVSDSKESIKLVSKLREEKVQNKINNTHPLKIKL